MNSKQSPIIQPDNVYQLFLKTVEALKGRYHKCGVKASWRYEKKHCIILQCGSNSKIGFSVRKNLCATFKAQFFMVLKL